MGNIILDRAYIGDTEASKIYLGSELIYEAFDRNIIFYMPTYNGGVPEVNNFGAINFTGGTDVGGWIGYDPAGPGTQSIKITPSSNVLKNNLLITFKAKWYKPANAGTVLAALRMYSDKLYTSEDGTRSNEFLGMYIGFEEAQNKDMIDYSKSFDKLTTVYQSDNDHLFTLGGYVNTSLKRCYLGVYNESLGTLAIPSIVSSNYLEYNNSFYFDLGISSFGNLLPINYYKDIIIKNINSVNLSTGKITYL